MAVLASCPTGGRPGDGGILGGIGRGVWNATGGFVQGLVTDFGGTIGGMVEPFAYVATHLDRVGTDFAAGVDYLRTQPVSTRVEFIATIATGVVVSRKLPSMLPKARPAVPEKLYVNGSASANNLTPRLTDVDGLSAWDTLAGGVKRGGKGQCFTVACLEAGGMTAAKTGPPGHWSIRPIAGEGLANWLASRAAGSFPESPYTKFLQQIAEAVWNR
jgi:hypothetical protein